MNPTGPSACNALKELPEARVGTPPQELITNSRWAPFTSDHTAGLLESTSPGRANREAETRRAVGVRVDCASIVAIAAQATSALLKLFFQLLERVIRGHVG